MTTATLAMFLCLATPAAVDTVVVCPQPLRAALQPWIDYRTAQGHELIVVSASGDATEVRERIVQAARAESLRAVVLVGDADPAASVEPALRARSLATYRLSAKVNVAYGSPPHIGSDHPYGDLDNDGRPDVAVGRLTADSSAELSTMIGKIIAYEQNAPADARQRTIHLVAGHSGFGTLIDSAIESAARSILRDRIPATHGTTLTQANWRSPYCPPPSEFRATTIRRLNEGCLFWVYMGHSHVQYLEHFELPGDKQPIFDIHAVPRLQAGSGHPIAVFLACYAGAFDARLDCLAEELLRSDSGPVAVVAGTRVTMPYAMSVLGVEMLDDYFGAQHDSLGELLLAAKQRSLDERADDTCRAALNTVARVLNPLGGDLRDERQEHVQMFHLLGDPWLRLHRPPRVTLDAPSQVTAGSQLVVTGRSPIDGMAEVELVVSRDRLTFTSPERARYDSEPAAQEQFRDTYERANDTRLLRERVAVEQGSFRAVFTVPEHAHGACHVRVTVHGLERYALGSRDVSVTQLPAAGPLP